MDGFIIILVIIFICVLIAVAFRYDRHISKESKSESEIKKVEPDKAIDKPEEDGFFDKVYEQVFSEHQEAGEEYTTCFVVGGYYRSPAAQEEYSLCRKGYKLTLRREPDNIHDRNAVKVISDRKHIGYLSREDAAEIAPLLDAHKVSFVMVKDNKYAFKTLDSDLMEIIIFYKKSSKK